MRRLADLVILALAVLVLAWGSSAYASPIIWLDGTYGNDADDGRENFPVQSWGRVIQLCSISRQVVTDMDTGVKWKGDTDTPPWEVAELLANSKGGRTETHDTIEVVPGHGQVSDFDEVKSDENGWGIRVKHNWRTIINAHGEQEYEIAPNNSIFSY